MNRSVTIFIQVGRMKFLTVQCYLIAKCVTHTENVTEF